MEILARVAIGALLLSVLPLTEGAVAPPPVAAACGTAWHSETEPPPTIRVLRTASGKVETVDLQHYVAVVMASGEWPTSLPEPLLEAGALAVKQYGWYYALKGHHRGGHHTASGVCYDVRDDSEDQVYRPENAEPTDKQRSARDALWGLSLRKGDEFLLTGYREGSATKCAADADGWHLYTRSARDCANRPGYDSQRILHEYYGPKLRFVWAPGTEPSPGATESDAAGGTHDVADEASTGLGDLSAWFSAAVGGIFGPNESPSPEP